MSDDNPNQTLLQLQRKLVDVVDDRPTARALNMGLWAFFAALAGVVMSSGETLGTPWWTFLATGTAGTTVGAATSRLRTRLYVANTPPVFLVRRYLRRTLENHQPSTIGLRPRSDRQQAAYEPGRTVRVQLTTAAAIAEQLDDPATLAAVLQLSVDASELDDRAELTELAHSLIGLGDELFERAHTRNVAALAALTVATDAYVSAVTDVTNVDAGERTSTQTLTSGEREQAIRHAPAELRRLHADAAALVSHLEDLRDELGAYPKQLDDKVSSARQARVERAQMLGNVAQAAIDLLEQAAVALNGARSRSVAQQATELATSLTRARKDADELADGTNVVPLRDTSHDTRNGTGTSLTRQSDHG